MLIFQINQNELNGLIVDMSSEGVYGGVKRLINDNELKNRFINK